MQFGVLGPLAVRTDAGEPVVVPGAKVRVLLADLLANRNRVVSADRLIDDLWGDDPPANPAAALQVRVSQLRKALNDAEPGARDLIESRAPGYLLRTGSVDADRFAALAAGPGAEQLTEALGLWRGDAYADVADQEFARAEATRLAEQRLVAQERLAQARLARGEAGPAAADLAGLVTRHPLREGLRALHMRALYAAGRQSEALAGFAELRERLAAELGLDPGPELTELHRRILVQDAGLTAPPPAAPVHPGLPSPLDELVGRAGTLIELRALLDTQRLITLAGPGGVGKTRLAVEVARERPAAVLVELAALPPGDRGVADRVLAVLDVPEAAGPRVPAGDRLVAALRQRDLVIVLDNCEHVLDAAAALTGRLLREAPGVTVLATSREPLGLAGEVVREVPPLAVPDDDHDLDAVRESAAVRLFAARAATRHRDFRLDERTAPAVAQLCRRLDGLPLALELAATRIRSLGLTGVIERLGDRFRLLATTQRDLPERQRTLAAVIGWSWDLLDEPDRQVLARLSVFRDGCAAAAAEQVCGADLDSLGRLVERSLVVLDETGAAPRYRMLESVAAYAAERLTGEAAVRARHAEWFTALAERADPHLRGPEQQRWLATLDAEAANLGAALTGGGGARLADALAWYWFLRGRLTDARAALAGGGDPAWRLGFAVLQGDPVLPDDLRAAVAADPHGRAAWFVAAATVHTGDLELAGELLPARPADRWTEAAVLSTRAMLAHAVGDQAALEHAGERSAALFAELGDRWGRLQANAWIGGLAEMRGDHARAAALHREGLRWAEELGLWPEVSSELSWLAWLAVQTGDHGEARELAVRAYRIAVELGSPTGIVFAETGLGMAARRAGDLDAAERHLGAVAERGRAEKQPALYLPMILVELGHLASGRGDPAAALALHREAFEAAEAIASPRDGVGALEGLASVAPPEQAAGLLGAAAAAREAIGAPAAPAERDETGRIAARLRAELGEERYDDLLTAGRALSPAEAYTRAAPAGR